MKGHRRGGAAFIALGGAGWVKERKREKTSERCCAQQNELAVATGIRPLSARTSISVRAGNTAAGCAQLANTGAPAAVACVSAPMRACRIARAPGSPRRTPADTAGSLARCACSSAAFGWLVTILRNAVGKKKNGTERDETIAMWAC